MPDAELQPERQTLVSRLDRIESRLRAIRALVLRNPSCLEVLQELAAAESALSRTSSAVFKFHVEHCLSHPRPDQLDDRAPMGELVDIFDRFAH